MAGSRWLGSTVPRLVTIALLVAACSATSNNAESEPEDRSVRAPTPGSPPPHATTLDCRDPIGHMDAPPGDYEVIGDAVALLTSTSYSTALQTNATKDADASLRLFAKTRLLVRTGAESALIVPPRWQGRLSFRWGNTGIQAPTSHLEVGPCPGSTAWLAFPGGYLVSDPACVDLIVRTAGRDHRVSMGVGAPCAGQRPPPAPTDS